MFTLKVNKSNKQAEVVTEVKTKYKRSFLEKEDDLKQSKRRRYRDDNSNNTKDVFEQELEDCSKTKEAVEFDNKLKQLDAMLSKIDNPEEADLLILLFLRDKEDLESEEQIKQYQVELGYYGI